MVVCLSVNGGSGRLKIIIDATTPANADCAMLHIVCTMMSDDRAFIISGLKYESKPNAAIVTIDVAKKMKTTKKTLLQLFIGYLLLLLSRLSPACEAILPFKMPL